VNDLGQVIIEQHDLARRVEEAFGQCNLTVEMRKIADRLSTLNSPLKPSTAKGNQ
jgi:hypothetical protein